MKEVRDISHIILTRQLTDYKKRRLLEKQEVSLLSLVNFIVNSYHLFEKKEPGSVTMCYEIDLEEFRDKMGDMGVDEDIDEDTILEDIYGDFEYVITDMIKDKIRGYT